MQVPAQSRRGRGGGERDTSTSFLLGLLSTRQLLRGLLFSAVAITASFPRSVPCLLVPAGPRMVGKAMGQSSGMRMLCCVASVTGFSGLDRVIWAYSGRFLKLFSLKILFTVSGNLVCRRHLLRRDPHGSIFSTDL